MFKYHLSLKIKIMGFNFKYKSNKLDVDKV